MSHLPVSNSGPLPVLLLFPAHCLREPGAADKTAVKLAFWFSLESDLYVPQTESFSLFDHVNLLTRRYLPSSKSCFNSVWKQYVFSSNCFLLSFPLSLPSDSVCRHPELKQASNQHFNSVWRIVLCFLKLNNWGLFELDYGVVFPCLLMSNPRFISVWQMTKASFRYLSDLPLILSHVYSCPVRRLDAISMRYTGSVSFCPVYHPHPASCDTGHSSYSYLNCSFLRSYPFSSPSGKSISPSLQW